MPHFWQICDPAALQMTEGKRAQIIGRLRRQVSGKWQMANGKWQIPDSSYPLEI